MVSRKKSENVMPIVYECLCKLEYRGYDSFGFATVNPHLHVLKNIGAVSKFVNRENFPLHGSLGFAHTRWATHGGVTKNNAHPHTDCTNTIGIVHNGIISNHHELREELLKRGHVFKSETDTEIVAHLIEEELKTNSDFEFASVNAIRKLKGSFALVIGSSSHPDMLLAFRKESPLIIGIGKDKFFAASDVISFLKYTKRMIPLDDYEYAVLTRTGYIIRDWRTMKLIRKEPKIVNWNFEMAKKGDYDSFMEKEIFEQPLAFRESFYLDKNKLQNVVKTLISAKRIYVTASGTSYHAGLVFQYLMKELAGIPVLPVISSEFQNLAIVDEDTAVIFISQSGETADTLTALRYVKENGGKTIGIVNVIGSSIARECEETLFINAGPEIAVCATKSYLNQLSVLYQIAFEIAKYKGKYEVKEINKLEKEFMQLPELIKFALDSTKRKVGEIAKDIQNYDKSFYIGRGIGVPTAKEGSLKLREITYDFSMNFDGAGELKHGSISLVDSNMFVVAIVQNDETYEDIIGNIQECKSRNGKVITVASQSTPELIEKSDYVIEVPNVASILSPILYILPLQLLAVYVTKLRGLDPDRPRALAKSVTVK